MQAAVFHGIGDIRLEEMPRPRPGTGEAVVKVGAAGICGTDLRIYANGHHRIPPGTVRVLGHELAGEILELGQDTPGPEVGMRVGVAPNIGCGVCGECVAGWTNLCVDYEAIGISLDGAFAEYVRIPAQAVRQGNIVRIPDSIPYRTAALAEPLSSCLSGQEASGVGVNDVVLILGAGPIGVMHALLAKLAGARKVVVSGWPDDRLRKAEEHGADVIVNPKQEDLRAAVMEATHGLGADVVIVAVASPAAQEEALELARRRGRINYFAGLPGETPVIRFNSNLVHYQQLTVTGTTGSNLRQYRTALDLLAGGRVNLTGLVSARLPLDRFLEGIERAQTKKEMRILVEPHA